jgi:hypothetical protein
MGRPVAKRGGYCAGAGDSGILKRGRKKPMKYVVTLELEAEEGTTEADIRTALRRHGLTGDPRVKVLSVTEAETLALARSGAPGPRSFAAGVEGVSRTATSSEHALHGNLAGHADASEEPGRLLFCELPIERFPIGDLERTSTAWESMPSAARASAKAASATLVLIRGKRGLLTPIGNWATERIHNRRPPATSAARLLRIWMRVRVIHKNVHELIDVHIPGTDRRQGADLGKALGIGGVARKLIRNLQMNYRPSANDSNF